MKIGKNEFKLTFVFSFSLVFLALTISLGSISFFESQRKTFLLRFYFFQDKKDLTHFLLHISKFHHPAIF